MTAHVYSRIADASAEAKLTFGYDAGRKSDRDLMMVTVSQYYLADDGGMHAHLDSAAVRSAVGWHRQGGG